MNRKLKIALKRRSSEQGFALVVAVGMGLIMVLVGTTMLIRGRGDQVTASAQKATNQGLSAAETGITRYQDLINTNRIIATYTRTGTPGWTNAATIPGITSGCTSGGGSSTVTPASVTTWQNVDLNVPSDPTQGQYRLVDYTYTPNSGVIAPAAPGTGTLTVEGRVNQTGTGSTATEDVRTATTKLQVNIPVQQSDINNVPVPGLWIKSGTMPGNQKTKGNILLNDCSLSPAPAADSHQAIDTSLSPPGPYIDPVTGEPYQTKQVSLTFPVLPPKPTFITLPNNQVLGAISSSQTFPRIGDRSSTGAIYPLTGGVFEYSVASVSGNNTITIRNTPGVKVKFYLDGDIAKQTDFLHDCTTSGCAPTDFQIFGYGASGSRICLNGNGLIDAFIFAPAYSAGVDGNGQFRGSIWVNDFEAPSCSSSSNHIVVVQSASWTSLGLTPQSLPPRLSPISSWQRQEATP